MESKREQFTGYDQHSSFNASNGVVHRKTRRAPYVIRPLAHDIVQRLQEHPQRACVRLRSGGPGPRSLAGERHRRRRNGRLELVLY